MAKHALVVGGTGMLADVSLWMAEQGYHVSVIGREERKLARLVERVGNAEAVTGLSLDYHDSDALRRTLANAILQKGSVELVVAWIHSSATEAFGIVQEEVSKTGVAWEMYHVQGSGSYLKKERPEVSERCKYHAVRLGFVVEGDRSRWLTNQEIAAGTIEAVRTGAEELIVGTMEPWERRPGW